MAMPTRPLPVVEKWQRLLKHYLSGRANLRRAFVLIDARHGIKPVDQEIMTLLDSAAVTFQVVLTKADKLQGRPSWTRSSTRCAAKLPRHPAAFPRSS